MTASPPAWREELICHAEMILRKADVVKRGYSRGWELILSYSFQQAETAGFLKGTAHSKISEELEDLQACASQIHHPFLLPVLFLAHSMSTKNDISQRDARGWLRKIEHALSLRRPDRRPESEIDLGQVSHDLTECHAQVLFKPPAPYRKIVSRMIVAMECFWARLPEEKRDEKMSAVHGDLLSRLEFHGAKLDGTEAYGDVTRERLGIQRNAVRLHFGRLSSKTLAVSCRLLHADPSLHIQVQFVTAQAAQNDTRLNLDIANQQRRLAVITMRDSQAMKSLTLLGATFLPGTFVASIFSMTFFDFQEGMSRPLAVRVQSVSNCDPKASSMSSHIWIYFAFALPLTTLVLFGWFWWDRRLESRLALEEAQLARKADTFESLRSVSIPM